jgi:hypothetical protein
VKHQTKKDAGLSTGVSIFNREFALVQRFLQRLTGSELG